MYLYISQEAGYTYMCIYINSSHWIEILVNYIGKINEVGFPRGRQKLLLTVV